MNNPAFKDHFSGHAAGYRSGRPLYPPALFEWLAGQVPQRRLAWDAGCGNGQASCALAEHFERVIATDPSATQIANAQACPRVEYRVEPAEAPSLADGSVDLICIGQALHWFDFEPFYKQVRRVAAPGGWIAALTYSMCSVSPALDPVIDWLYHDVVGRYWPPDRRHVEEAYASLPFPFERVAVLPFAVTADWDLAQFCAYLRSWSSTQRYLAATGRDAVAEAKDKLDAAWGEPLAAQRVIWPLTVLAGRVA